MTARQDQASATKQANSTTQVFRSPVAAVAWWIWLLFAVGNLIDLAVQGRDRASLVAAAILILVTGLAYAALQRPRVIAGEEALTIVNPLREHRIGWAAVAGVEAADIVRIRCEWLTGRKTIYAWAISSSRRRQYLADMRTQRMASSRRLQGVHGYDAAAGDGASARGRAEPNDSERVAAAISARVDEVRAANAEAAPPASAWYWPALAAIAVPAIALVIVLFA